MTAQKTRWHANGAVDLNGVGVSLRRLDQVLNGPVLYADDDLTLTGTVTVNPGPLIVGVDPGGTQALRVGGAAHVSGDLTLDGRLTFTAASAKILLGATVLSFRTSADSATVMSINPTGGLRVTGSSAEVVLDARSGGGNPWELYAPTTASYRLYHASDQYIFTDTEFTPATDGGKTLGTASARWGDVRSNGVVYLSAAAAKIVPGSTSLSWRNNADSADNLLITDAGAATFRSTVGGITTLTATTFQSAGANPASSGTVALANLEGVKWRNAANSGDVSLSVDSNNDLVYSGTSARDINVSGGATGGYRVGSTKVVGTRKTGYTNAMTGTKNRAAAYDTSTITLQQLAERVGALLDDLTTHGLIGA